MRNILEYLENTAQRFPQRPAFSDDEKTLTFEEFHAKAKAVGSFLLSKDTTRERVLDLRLPERNRTPGITLLP